MATTFQNYLKENLNSKNVVNAEGWFREQAAKTVRLDTNRVIQDQKTRAVMRPKVGHLYLFKYDALTKDVLPYYDKFPIIFLIRPLKSGFLGLNMHYLPFVYRANLMDALYDYVVEENNEKKLKVTYKILSETSRLRFYRPCLKHYLNNQVKSRFIDVSPNDWNTAVFLPLQKFSGATTRVVHRDSVNEIKKYGIKGK